MTATIGRPRLNIDVTPLLEPRWTGLSVFTHRLADALIANGELEIEFVTRMARLPAAPVLRAMRMGTGAYLADALRPEEAQPLEVADMASQILYPAAKYGLQGFAAREASVIHDMTTLFMPETHDEWNIGLWLDHFDADVHSSEALFCISEATRASLGLASPSVIARTRLLPQYVDWPETFALTERNLPPPPLPPYALMLGAIEPRKNLELVLAALQHPVLARSSLRFVVVGPQGWRVETLLSDITPKQRERVTFTGYVSEFVKYRLLRHAEFLVFPSLCEGFGIPALEAMSLGKAVLAARAGSLPEVVGEAGVYFDPVSVDEFAWAFEEIADPRLRAELAPFALARAAEFTPERMAEPVVTWVKG